MQFRKLRADEIDVRVSTVSEKGCSLLLYKDARVDMNILDETVGPELWQRKHEVINGNLFCNVGILCGEVWVWKQDVGVESYTEKEKGQASDAFKRACVNWGIGRQLYTAPFIWVNADMVDLKDKNGKKTTYDRFAVKNIGYTDGEITILSIINRSKRGMVVFSMGRKADEPLDRISEKDVEILKAVCTRKGLDVETTFPGGIENLTNQQYAEAMRRLNGGS